jgi:hypothetical protein
MAIVFAIDRFPSYKGAGLKDFFDCWSLLFLAVTFMPPLMIAVGAWRRIVFVEVFGWLFLFYYIEMRLTR